MQQTSAKKGLWYWGKIVKSGIERKENAQESASKGSRIFNLKQYQKFRITTTSITERMNTTTQTHQKHYPPIKEIEATTSTAITEEQEAMEIDCEKEDVNIKPKKRRNKFTLSEDKILLNFRSQNFIYKHVNVIKFYTSNRDKKLLKVISQHTRTPISIKETLQVVVKKRGSVRKL